MSTISSKKQDKLKEIHNVFQKRLEEKMKKIYASTDLIKKLEQKKLHERENKKIERYGASDLQMLKHKNLFEEKVSKDKKRIIEVRENLEDLKKEYQEKNLELSNKLKGGKKMKKRNEILNKKVGDYLIKRQSSFDKFIENSDILKKTTQRRNMKFLKMQQLRNRKSHDKARSVDISKNNSR